MLVLQTHHDAQHLMVKILAMIEQFALGSFSPCRFGVEDFQDQLSGHPVSVPAAQGPGQVGLFDRAADHRDQVDQQRGICGMVDVGLHRDAVETHLAASLDALLWGPLHQYSVDGLPGV